jgi:hypothetical protein
MFQVSVIYPDGRTEQRQLTAMPTVGDPLDGPILDGGHTWKVSGIVRIGDAATLTAEAVAAPEMIYSDGSYRLTS